MEMPDVCFQAHFAISLELQLSNLKILWQLLVKRRNQYE